MVLGSSGRTINHGIFWRWRNEKINELKSSINNLSLIVRSDYKNSLVDSLNAGIDASKYNNIIWLDADYSHPPKYMEEIIKKNDENKYDLIFFSRFLI